MKPQLLYLERLLIIPIVQLLGRGSTKSPVPHLMQEPLWFREWPLRGSDHSPPFWGCRYIPMCRSISAFQVADLMP